MRIKQGYELIKSEDRYLVQADDAFVKELSVSDYSAFLWKLLKEKEVTKSQMLDSLLSEYDISTVLALGEIDNFLRMLRENGIAE